MMEAAKTQALGSNAFLQHLPLEEAPPTVVAIHPLDGLERGPPPDGRHPFYTVSLKPGPGPGPLTAPSLNRKPKGRCASIFAPAPVAATAVSAYAGVFSGVNYFSSKGSAWHSQKNAFAWGVLAFTAMIIGFLLGALPALTSARGKKKASSCPPQG